MLLGPDADERSVIRRMRDARIIHFATHGILDVQTNQSLPDVSLLLHEPQGVTIDNIKQIVQERLNLYNLYSSPNAAGALVFAKSGDEDGVLNATEILDMDLEKTELVVLSACDTGRGPLTPGGVIGLPFSFSIAGVPINLAIKENAI